MPESSLWLDEAELVHGATLAAARAPYLETDAGRLGLVSMTTGAPSGITQRSTRSGGMLQRRD